MVHFPWRDLCCFSRRYSGVLRRKSRKSLIVISFLPGGMDVRDRSEAAQRADRVIRRCIHQGYGLVESRPFNVLIEYRALVDLITAERVH